MIDYVTVIHCGGTVLWSHNNNTIKNTSSSTAAVATIQHTTESINTFINDILINESIHRKYSTLYKYHDYCMKWNIDYQYNIIIVAMYLNITNLLYVDELLASIRSDFIHTYNRQLMDIYNIHNNYDYSSRYQKILSKYEYRAINHVNESLQHTTLNNNTNNKLLSNSQSDHSIRNNKHTISDNKSIDNNTDVDSVKQLTQSQSTDSFAVDHKHQSIQAHSHTTPRKPGPMKKKSPANATTTNNNESSSSKKKGKQMRTWDGQTNKLDAQSLDRSNNSSFTPSDIEQMKINDIKDKFYGDSDKPVDYSDNENDGSDEDDDIELHIDNMSNNTTNKSSANWLHKTMSSISKNVTGVLSGRVLDSDDLRPVIDSLKSQLMSKNVAADIASTLCDQVYSRLINTKIQSFTSIKSIVYTAVEQALTRVLTPRIPVDVLQGIELARQHHRPYSIVMIGVNGVGKSTSLSKLASYFISKSYKVGFGACDTFRAGAIEQLRTHATVLNVPLYSKGYDKDAATVAYDAIQSAKRDQCDVILIDTAGRMQHNEPLMKSLCKLITLNTPDLILFVGEALVGNDAVDQITEFNKSLINYSDTDKPRLIDGIVLTKFDTIDDKVGAAISLTYNTGIPIVFVGTGQTYRDLKKLNIKTINKMLLR